MWYPSQQLTFFEKCYRRDKFTLHSKAIVCQDVELKGDITIGSGLHQFSGCFFTALKRCVPGTIVHPKATIFAIAGPIVIGMGCIIEEGVIIVNRYVLNFNLIADAIPTLGERRSCELATRTFSKLVVVRIFILENRG